MELTEKITYGLVRLSDVFRTLLWDKAKTYGVSPIQIQLLLFIDSHKRDLCNITHLSKEFSLTKPTVSDAIKVLHSKGYLEKDFSTTDSRSYRLVVTPAGKKLISELSNYSFPVDRILLETDQNGLESIYQTLLELIYRLNQQGIIKVQRTCFGCRSYEQRGAKHYCNFLKTSLKPTELRLDCAEFTENRTY